MAKKMIAEAKSLKIVDTTFSPVSYYPGMTGLAACFGLMHTGKPKVGEIIVISGAAGAVGVVVGQILFINP